MEEYFVVEVSINNGDTWGPHGGLHRPMTREEAIRLFDGLVEYAATSDLVKHHLWRVSQVYKRTIRTTERKPDNDH